MATAFVTGKVRLSYVKVFQPSAAPGTDKLKYSVSVIVDKSDKETLRKINAAIEEAKEQGKASKWGGKIPANLKLPLRDGDTDKPDDEAYKGKYFFNASSERKPGVVDINVNPILDPEEVYSGCYGRVHVNFYPFNSNGNRGIAVGLNHVQKVADGERLGGGAISVEAAFSDAFEEEEDFLD